MNRMLAIAAIMLGLTAWLAADVADARRLGGGRSFGAQRQMTPAPSTPNATPNAPGSTAPSVAPRTATPATPAAAPASGMSRWLGPIAGIAAGLGLAALMSHLGLSDAFGSFLLIGLLAVGAIFLVRRFLMARPPAPSASGVNTGVFAPFPPQARETRVEPTLARPVPATAPPLPAGFEPEPFLQQAKLQFR